MKRTFVMKENAMYRTGLILLVVLAFAPAAAQAAVINYALITDLSANAINRYDADTRAFDQALAPGVNGLGDIELGPDGNLYANASTGFGTSSQILRYTLDGTAYPASGRTGAEVLNANDDLNHLYAKFGDLAGGPDGYLYAASINNNAGIYRYDPVGNTIALFIAGSGYREMVFGPDANGDGFSDLYAGRNAGVEVIDPLTASLIDIDGAGPKAAGDFVEQSAGGLANVTGLAFGGGRLLVTDAGDNRIHVFDAATGDPVDMDGAGGLDPGIFRSSQYNKAGDLAVGPDGYLYMAERFGGVVRYFDINTADQIGTVTASNPNAVMFYEIPEPGTLVLLALGSIAALARRRRR